MSRRLFEYHPVIGYRFIPELRARVEHESGGYLIRTNASGFRCDHEFRRERTAGKRRALLFGDSFSAADGVSNGKRYGDVLEATVERLEVYNFALPGTGTDQQYLAYQEFAKDIEHDLLIVAVLVENIRRIVSRYRIYENEQGRPTCYAKPYFELVDGTLTLRQSPPPPEPIELESLAPGAQRHVDRGGRLATLRRVVSALGLKEIAQKVTGYQPLPEYDQPDGPAWQLMRAILRQWLTGHPRPVVLMPLPLHQYVEQTADPSGYQRRFGELAAEIGCVLHDPLADLWRYSAEERRGFRFRTDVHPTPAGHAALGASLAPVVRRVLERAPEPSC